MLTVKLVEAGGHEQIREAKNVWTSPEDDGAVRIEEPDGSSVAFGGGDGTLYVMNEAGHTIARYHMKNGKPA